MSEQSVRAVVVDPGEASARDGGPGRGAVEDLLDARALGLPVALVAPGADAGSGDHLGDLASLADVVVGTDGAGPDDPVEEAARLLGVAPSACGDVADAEVAEAWVREDGRLRLRGGWSFGETGFRPTHEQQLGSNHMVGNGYLGYRGTFAEWRGADGWVACVVSGTYDTADGKWRELTTAPNALHGWWEADGEPLVVPAHERHDDTDDTDDTDGGDGPAAAPDGRAPGGDARAGHARVEEVTRTYDVRHARSRRTTRFATGGATVTLEEQRFAHLERVHVVAQRHRVRVSAATDLVLHSGIDARIWSLNGVHLPDVGLHEEDGVMVAVGTTVESGVTVAVARTQVVAVGSLEESGPAVAEDERLLRRAGARATPSEPIVVDTYHAVFSSNDVKDPVAAAVAEARSAAETGWDALSVGHARAWQQVWGRADVVVEGDLLAQTSLRFAVLQQVLCTPRHDPALPIGARGLSCQAYQGAAFWDQEVFNLPMWLHTEPRVARQLLEYRIRTLDGARGKARRLGFDGAFYAWVSGDTGEELCPDFFFTDVLTGRPIRNHFNDWQIHVSPDISLTFRRYVAATGDTSILVDGGAEVVAEIARFCVSRVSLRPDTGRGHVLRVLGPDEYHENVDDNAFTNHVLHAALDHAVEVAGWMRLEHASAWRALSGAIGLDDDEIERWADVRDRLVLPAPDPATGVIEQFTGFHRLEDVGPSVLRERLQDPSEYWGWPNGVAVHTQVSKQADVVQLLVQLPERFDEDVVAANHDHYLDRTQHGSSLSRSAYAVTAAGLGRADEAREHLLASATVDLLGTSATTSGGTFIGGIRTAAAGGSWLALVQGLLGMHVGDDGAVGFAPVLPAAWDRLSVRLVVRGARCTVTVDRDGATLRVDDADATLRVEDPDATLRVEDPDATLRVDDAGGDEPTASLPLRDGEQVRSVAAGETVELRRR